MDSSYSYSSSYSSGDTAATFAILGFALVFTLVIYVIFSFLLGKLFKKAGIEAWKAWVPIYNQWVFLELGGQKGWIALLSLANVIPLVGWIGAIVTLVYSCIAALKIGRGFGKEDWWVVLYIFASPIWVGIIAFDDSKWQGLEATRNPQQPSVPGNGQPPFQPPAPVPAPNTPEQAPQTPENPAPSTDSPSAPNADQTSDTPPKNLVQ